MKSRLMMSVCFAMAVACTTGWQCASAEEGHAEFGPHKGSLVELGDEEYHAEVVHDEKAGTVTIYLLGSDAKSTVTTDAKEVALNAKVSGKAIQMKLKAAPQKGDKAGTTSCFASKSKELVNLLDNEQVKPSLRVTIAGKTFNGAIAHHHEHEHTNEKPAAPKKK